MRAEQHKTINLSQCYLRSFDNTHKTHYYSVTVSSSAAAYKMAQIRLFIFIGLVALISGQCTDERARQFFKRSVYDFSVQLSSRISLETDGHFIASGLSPWTLLSALSLGATEDTLVEIIRVLKMHPHQCFNNKYFRFARELTSLTNDTILEKSAAMFVDQKLEVKEDFQFEVRRAAVCDVKVLDFEEYASTAAFINDYVSRATHEAIDEIVTPSDVDGAYIIMIDALYFKGAWKLPFPYADTENSAFYNHKDNQIGDVNLMFVSGTFNITSSKLVQADILELPYGDQNRFSMLLFLPKRGVTVTTVIENLKAVSLRTIFALFGKRGETIVNVQIPRFKITSDINNLKELLIDMGLQKIFDSGAAKFDDLTSFNVYVSNFIQKADIEVTEDGTEAAAASEAVLEARMLPEQFIANKPFLFMIIDRETEVPLFTGAYSKPQLF